VRQIRRSTEQSVIKRVRESNPFLKGRNTVTRGSSRRLSDIANRLHDAPNEWEWREFYDGLKL
jgi:hypothetical protein